jgi:hypothetical protein
MSTFYCDFALTGSGHAGTELDPFTFGEMETSIGDESGNAPIYKCKGSCTSSISYFDVEDATLEPWDAQQFGPPRVGFTVCNDVYIDVPGSINGFIIQFDQADVYLDCTNTNAAFVGCWLFLSAQYYETIFHKCVIIGNLSSTTPLNDPLALAMYDCIIIGTITSQLNNILVFVNCCTTGAFTGTGTSHPESVTKCQSGWTCLMTLPAWDASKEEFLYVSLAQNISTPPQPGIKWQVSFLWGDRSFGIGTGYVIPPPPGGYGGVPYGDSPYKDEITPPVLIVSTPPIAAVTRNVLTKTGLVDFKLNYVANADMSNGLEDDLALENFDLVLIDGVEQIRQKLKIRLQFFMGEWYLDTTLGTRYYQDVLIKNPQLSKLQALFKAVIMETIGVTQLTAFTLSVNNAARTMVLSFTVATLYGTITMQESL